MSISDNISTKIEKIHEEREAVNNPDAVHEIGDDVRKKAMNAIFGDKEHFVTYMQLFANNEEELARLMPTEGGGEEEEKRNIARAYLVANGMCAPGTGDGLLNNVTNQLNLP